MHSITICARCDALSASFDCSWKDRQLEAHTPILNTNKGDEDLEDIENENFDGFCENCQDWIDNR